MEIVKDMQDELRQLARCLSAPGVTPEDALQRAVHMRAQLDGLTAGLVGLARDRRLTWSAIGELLGIGEDTARHRFTQAHITRRLGQLVRPRTEPQPAARQAPPAPAAEGVQPAKTPPPLAPAPPDFRAGYNRLAPVLSMLARACDLPLQTIAKKTGCSPSYLSRLLSGDRVPTWSLTENFAKACGADPAVLRKVWETERLREKAPKAPPSAPPADESPRAATDELLAALHTLHARAGMPTAYEIAVASQWRLTPDRVTELLGGGGLEEWEDLAKLLYTLGGEQSYFRPLWQAARATADHMQAPVPPTTPEPPLPPAGEDTSERVPGILERFSGVLATRPALSPRQERVLKAKRGAVLASLAERIDGHTNHPPHDQEPAPSEN